MNSESRGHQPGVSIAGPRRQIQRTEHQATENHPQDFKLNGIFLPRIDPYWNPLLSLSLFICQRMVMSPVPPLSFGNNLFFKGLYFFSFMDLCVHRYLKKPEEAIRSPEAGCWKLNLGFPQENQAFFVHLPGPCSPLFICFTWVPGRKEF